MKAGQPVELDLSIVTTARNEAGNIEEFFSRSVAAIERLGLSGEIIFFDDASLDDTFAEAKKFAEMNPKAGIRLVRNSFQRGIVSAIVRGGSMARGKVVCFVPADLESLPDEDIPKLYEGLDDQSDVIVGWRQGRGDNKLFASRLYNKIMAVMFGVKVHDANWIKLMRREKLEDLVLLPDWHSVFVGLLADRGCRIKEVPTQWHPRKFGRSKFGKRRFAYAVAAALSSRAYLSFGERPLLLFLVLTVLFVLVAIFFALVAVLLPGGNFVLMLVSLSALLLGSISASAGLTVEALRWGRTESRFHLTEPQTMSTAALVDDADT